MFGNTFVGNREIQIGAGLRLVGLDRQMGPEDLPKLASSWAQRKAELNQARMRQEVTADELAVFTRRERNAYQAAYGKAAQALAGRVHSLMTSSAATGADRYAREFWSPSRVDQAQVAFWQEQFTARLSHAPSPAVARAIVDEYASATDASKVYALWRNRSELAKHRDVEIRMLSGTAENALTRFLARDEAYQRAVQEQNAVVGEAVALGRQLRAAGEDYELSGRGAYGPWSVLGGSHPAGSAAEVADLFQVHPSGRAVAYFEKPGAGAQPTTVVGTHSVEARASSGSVI